jgi:DNA-binding transcriptional MerR regulator
MQIGQAAARTELSITTIRHYDAAGLVTPSARSAGGFRLYTEADVERLLVIRRMKPLRRKARRRSTIPAGLSDED